MLRYSAIALEAEKIITRPMATSDATAEKEQRVGRLSDVRAARGSDARLRLRAKHRLAASQRVHGGGELLAAIFGRAEHVERRAARREQHHVAAAPRVGAPSAPLRPSTRRARSRRPARVCAICVCRLADQHQRLGALTNRDAHLDEIGAFRAAARDQARSAGRTHAARRPPSRDWSTSNRRRRARRRFRRRGSSRCGSARETRHALRAAPAVSHPTA